MNRDNNNITEAYLKSRLLKEGMENTYPSNWNKGFAYPIRIAGDGTEEPFLKDGKWHIRVYDAEKKQHFIYSYADDTFYPEDHGISESHPYGGDYEEGDPDQEYDLKAHKERKQEEEGDKEEDAEAFAGPQTGQQHGRRSFQKYRRCNSGRF